MGIRFRSELPRRLRRPLRKCFSPTPCGMVAAPRLIYKLKTDITAGLSGTSFPDPTSTICSGRKRRGLCGASCHRLPNHRQVLEWRSLGTLPEPESGMASGLSAPIGQPVRDGGIRLRAATRTEGARPMPSLPIRRFWLTTPSSFGRCTVGLFLQMGRDWIVARWLRLHWTHVKRASDAQLDLAFRWASVSRRSGSMAGLKSLRQHPFMDLCRSTRLGLEAEVG